MAADPPRQQHVLHRRLCAMQDRQQQSAGMAKPVAHHTPPTIRLKDLIYKPSPSNIRTSWRAPQGAHARMRRLFNFLST